MQGGLECGGLQVRQGDAVSGGLLTHGLADAPRGVTVVGLGARFEFDRKPQLVDRGHRGHLGVVLIRARPGVLGDDPDLIQRQAALAHLGGAARELVKALGDGGHVFGGGICHAQFPGHQRFDRAHTFGGGPQTVAVDLGDDFHDAPIDGVALSRQLGQLLQQAHQTLVGTHIHLGIRRSDRHDHIITEGSDI
ncbi:hypothetical protein AU072_24630 [Mycolicibacterium novocastrense]|nr:hypothetical protein AU072_24630 [Mycolicibacterium novocastrense]